VRSIKYFFLFLQILASSQILIAHLLHFLSKSAFCWLEKRHIFEHYIVCRLKLCFCFKLVLKKDIVINGEKIKKLFQVNKCCFRLEKNFIVRLEKWEVIQIGILIVFWRFYLIFVKQKFRFRDHVFWKSIDFFNS